MILFIDVWQGSKYASGGSFVCEIMLAIDDFSSKSDSLKSVQITRNKNWNTVIDWSDFAWCYWLSNTLVTQFFLLSIFCSILCYLTRYGFKGNLLLHTSRPV